MQYYVYELTSSLDGNTFYVGKGRGRRMYLHEIKAKRPLPKGCRNRKLRNKILSILEKGGEILYHQIFFTGSNEEAYKKETERIKEIGLENLCNILIHPLTPEECYQLRSIQMTGTKLPEETKQKIRKKLQGHQVTLKTRLKMRMKKLGKKQPCVESKRLSIARSRRPVNGFPKIISPEGITHTVEILTDFCKTHQLRLSNMSDLFHRRVKSHRGWMLADNPPIQKNPVYL